MRCGSLADVPVALSSLNTEGEQVEEVFSVSLSGRRCLLPLDGIGDLKSDTRNACVGPIRNTYSLVSHIESPAGFPPVASMGPKAAGVHRQVLRNSGVESGYIMAVWQAGAEDEARLHYHLRHQCLGHERYPFTDELVHLSRRPSHEVCHMLETQYPNVRHAGALMIEINQNERLKAVDYSLPKEETVYVKSPDLVVLERQTEEFRVEREAREASAAAKIVAAYSMTLLNSHCDLTIHRPEIERALDRLNAVIRRMDERRAA